ncbi:Ubiquinone biosynthesis O-methyltransferase [subsurface metagenome]
MDIGCGKRGLGTFANIDIEHSSIIPDNFQIMDGHDLHFPDNSFEAVSIVEVIEHVENPSQVLREIYRVLKKDGKMFLTTPNPSHISIFIKNLRNKRIRIHPDHLHTWNWEMLAWLIHNVGFRDIEIYLWGFVDEMLREGKPVKLYRAYRLANILYSLGFRNPMLHLNIFIKCRK